MKIILLALFSMLMSSGTIFGQQNETDDSKKIAEWRTANYSDVKYKLGITIGKNSLRMSGTIEISLNLTEEGTKKDLIPDWRPAQSDNEREPPFAIVGQVNNTRYPFGAIQVKNGRLTIPSNALKTGENVVKIWFASPVTRYIDKADGAEYVYYRGGKNGDTALPFFDQPELKARFELEFDVPENWKVITNERRIAATKEIECPDSHCSPIPIGFKRYIFFSTSKSEPIGIKEFVFAAGEFAEIEDLADIGPVKTAPIGSTRIYEPLRNPNAAKVYVRKSQEQKFREIEAKFFRLNRSRDKFAKLDIILLPEIFNTQSEYDGIKFVPEGAVFR